MNDQQPILTDPEAQRIVAMAIAYKELSMAEFHPAMGRRGIMEQIENEISRMCQPPYGARVEQ